jgi:uncharacterized protein (TIGR03437 family)
MQFPPSNSSGTQFQGFAADDNCPNPVITGTGPANVRQMVAKPDGTRFYTLGSGGVQSIDPAFASTSFHPVNGITGTPTAMAMSPDGRYLYIGAGAPGLFVLDTSTDTILPNSVPLSGTTILGVAFSSDSSYAYLLTNSSFISSIVRVSTSSRAQVGTPLNLPFGCGANAAGVYQCYLSMSPRQLLYVSNGAYIFEVDPVAMALTSTGQITTNTQTLGPLRFTPDGSAAYAVSLTPAVGGRSLLQVKFPGATISELNYANSGITPPTFTDVYPASASRVFAVTGPDTTLWDVTPAPFGAQPATSVSIPGGVNNALSATLSNEQPAARYLYLLNANGFQTNLLKIDLTTNSIVASTLATLGPGVLNFVAVPPQTGATAFVQFNNNQVLNPGATAAPLAAIVTNSAGVPLYNIPVTFAVDPASGITLTNASTVTNSNGYVQATATLPSTSGSYAVTLTAGTATATFNLTVSGSGGGPGGSTQVTVYSGNGQLIYTTQNSNVPMTVKVTAPDGVTPLANVPVAFSISTGPGTVFPTGNAFDANGNPLTDQNGFASAFFRQPFGINGGYAYQQSSITATTAVGSVTFYQTTYQLNQDGTGQPSFIMTQPSNLAPIPVGEGDVVPNAIMGNISSSVLPPFGGIPNIGIRIADPSNPLANSSVAACQGAPLSDNNGNITCNLVISCSVGAAQAGIQPIWGEKVFLPGFGLTLQIGPGSSRAIGMISGNNQSGNAGQPLGQALVARVSDNCGTPVSGIPVTWKVTQGSATLANTVSTSDAGGNVSTKVVLGAIPGPVQVIVSLSTTSQVTFSATNNVTVASITITSGNNQTSVAGQPFANPLTFTVKDSNGSPLSGVPVTFSVLSGSASLNPASVNTNSAGQASVNVSAGFTPGPVVVQAKASTLVATANLTINAPGPVITATSFVNAASLQPGIVGCGLATATGSGIAPTLTPGQVVLGNPLGFGPLPYTIVTTSVTINGIPAPLYALSNSVNGIQQVTFQTPCETQAGTATVSITVGSGANAATTTVTGVQVFSAHPGIFTSAGPNGKTYGAVIRGVDGSYVTPSNLARRGETYYLVATGLGQTTPPAATNGTGAGQTVPNTVIVGVNNAGMPVISAQYVAIGVYYVGFQIPLNATQGVDQNLALGEVVGGQTVYDNQGALLAGVQ